MGETAMPRTVTPSLLAAVVFALAPLAAHAQGEAKPPAFPEGKAKPFVEGLCGSCHALNLIQNSSGYTRDQWKELVGYMVDLSNSPQQNDILDYLAANFAPNNQRAAKPVPGNFQV